jgi:hypothetical protein
VVGAVGNHDFGGPLAVLGDDGPRWAEFEDHERVGSWQLAGGRGQARRWP